jgi:hypothetical protein
VLTGEQKKQIYDRHGEEGLKAHEGGQHQYANPFDMFSQFFGGGCTYIIIIGLRLLPPHIRIFSRSPGTRAGPPRSHVRIRVRGFSSRCLQGCKHRRTSFPFYSSPRYLHPKMNSDFLSKPVHDQKACIVRPLSRLRRRHGW